jgi:hypothetical protein
LPAFASSTRSKLSQCGHLNSIAMTKSFYDFHPFVNAMDVVARMFHPAIGPVWAGNSSASFPRQACVGGTRFRRSGIALRSPRSWLVRSGEFFFCGLPTIVMRDRHVRGLLGREVFFLWASAHSYARSPRSWLMVQIAAKLWTQLAVGGNPQIHAREDFQATTVADANSDFEPEYFSR